MSTHVKWMEFLKIQRLRQVYDEMNRKNSVDHYSIMRSRRQAGILMRLINKNPRYMVGSNK